MTEASEASLPVSGRSVAPLPLTATARPQVYEAARGKIGIRLDGSGALLRSDNAGKKWKPVKPVWKGKVIALAALPHSDFRLTTDAGEA